VPRGVERREGGKLYGRVESEIAGPLQPAGPTVQLQPAMTRRQQGTMLGAAGLHLATTAALIVLILQPAHLPVFSTGVAPRLLTGLGLGVMVLLQAVNGIRTLGLAFFLANARDPIPMRAQPGLKVAVLTTIVPGKEPLELVLTTLRAMKRLRHDGELDVWLLDEGNDPEVRERCTELGVHHFSRKGERRWNQREGLFRARTKHGNHNAWRQLHADQYDVVTQMDPDHVPYPHFLERTLGYFNDPDVGFVVAPQVYGNLTESFVVRGAAQLSYIFHGIIQRGANRFFTPLLIGTNHLYRPAAFAMIGGYQDSIIEDHLTAMRLYTERNPVTGNRWKGVYTPDVLAVGEGPSTYTDWFSQQKRWAYGIWEIIVKHSPRLLPLVPSWGGRLTFATLQMHYPLVAINWVGGVLLFLLYLLGGITVTDLPLLLWSVLFAGNIALGLALFRLTGWANLARHERATWNLTGMLMDLVTAPVYTAAAVALLSGRPLMYVVTAKGSAATHDTWRTFRPQFLWLGVAVASITAGLLLGHSFPTLIFWAVFTAVVCLVPLVHTSARRLTDSTPALLRWHSSDVARRRIGEVLVAQGSLTLVQLRQLLDLQASHDDRGGMRLGDLAVHEGLITPAQLTAAILGSGTPHPAQRADHLQPA
jgi:cellulose synthase (UDP-forming)